MLGGHEGEQEVGRARDVQRRQQRIDGAACRGSRMAKSCAVRDEGVGVEMGRLWRC